jgi:hypothetical protein
MKVIIVLVLNLFACATSFAANFDDVLLIINYNHAHYESMPILREIYKKYFKNIVFYGPKQHPDVVFDPQYAGYFSYTRIADAMKRYPAYKGYFFLMDDCILNTWLLQDIDQSKIWYPHMQWWPPDEPHYKGVSIDLSLGAQPNLWWCWWKSQWGYIPTSKAFYEMPQENKDMLEQNWGPHRVVSAFSDIAYIPSTYSKQFIELANTFGKHQVFLEIALPTIIYSLELGENMVWFPSHGNNYQNPPRPAPIKNFNIQALCNHPIKLSYPENQKFVLDLFEQFN